MVSDFWCRVSSGLRFPGDAFTRVFWGAREPPANSLHELWLLRGGHRVSTMLVSGNSKTLSPKRLKSRHEAACMRISCKVMMGLRLGC